MNNRALRVFVIVQILIAALACQRSPDVIADHRGGSITVADLDRYLLAQPEIRRQVAKDESPEEWVRYNLERLAVRRILENSECAEERSNSTEMRAFRDWTRSGLLAQRLAAQIGQDWEPNPDELAAEIEEMRRQAATNALYTFRHIYFRTDRAASTAEVEATRRQARHVAEIARSGADFDALVREHSDSQDADRGGVVGNVPPTALDDTTAAILGSMSEGDVSHVVETRTGLHIFRLDQVTVTDPPSEEQIVSNARNNLRRRQLEQHRTALVEEVRSRVPVKVDESGWSVGSWQLDRSVLDFVRAPAGVTAEELEARVTEQLLMAQEALDQDLETPEIDAEVERIMTKSVVDRCRDQIRQELLSELPEDVLREVYEAQPTLFTEQEKAHVELIFVPRGKDGFATQRMLENLVAELRHGASFADAARRLSTGPGAEDGGDLGMLERNQWAAFNPTVFRALREIEVGVVSDPIYCTDEVSGSSSLLRGGFAVIRVSERIPARSRSFEEAVDDVRRAWGLKNRDLLQDRIVDRILERGDFAIVRLPSPDELGS